MEKEVVERVIKRLTQIDKDLHSLNLPQLIPFNITYLIISRNIAKRLKTSYFKSDRRVVSLLVNFASYYFTALDNYQKDIRVAPAWKQVFKSSNLPKLVQLGLGANAHINNDLPQALKSIDESFKEDYKKLKDIVDLSLGEILAEFNLADSPLKNFYIKVMTRETKRWREKAWENSLKLKRGEISKKDLEKRAKFSFKTIYSSFTWRKS